MRFDLKYNRLRASCLGHPVKLSVPDVRVRCPCVVPTSSMTLAALLLFFLFSSSAQDAMYANWFVLSSEDVADFAVLIRDSKNNVFYNKAVAYTMRSLTITIDEDLTDAIQNGGSLELCIQTKNSQHYARKWYPNQCRSLPKDFNSLPKKLNVDKRRLVGKKKSRGFFSNNVLRMVSDSILITLCIFLGVCFRRISHFF
ncbi:hypothetical protein EVAR_7413_1 [Eumeta japonica]|uniref:Uncharacterized protein n=1 Tax=Eumeta variegata TaxID=151549 RepID=A0A4C1V6D0_EUMVA|nr:hypothetical protein EVAR_7413_1 [Eumeta japonica]